MRRPRTRLVPIHDKILLQIFELSRLSIDRVSSLKVLGVNVGATTRNRPEVVQDHMIN